MSKISYLWFCAVIFLFVIIEAKAEKCEVCIKTMGDILTYIKENKVKNDMLEKAMKTVCSKYSQNSKENRVCWYMGAMKDSASYLLGSISKHIQNSIPVEKICQKLGQMDRDICQVKFSGLKDEDEEEEKEKVKVPKTINLSKTKLSKLKKFLRKWGENCYGCEDKEAFVQRVLELSSTHDPDNKYIIEEPTQYRNIEDSEINDKDL